MTDDTKIRDLSANVRPISGVALGVGFLVRSFAGLAAGSLPTLRAPRSGIADDWRAVGRDLKEAMRKHASP